MIKTLFGRERTAGLQLRTNTIADLAIMLFKDIV